MTRRRALRAGVVAGAVAATVAVVLAGCAAPAAEPLPRREVAAATAADPAQPCVREAPATAPTEAPGAPADLDVRYDPAANTIALVAGTGVTLPVLSSAIGNPAALSEVAPGEWLLGADLVVHGGAALHVAAPEVRWLKLSSDAGRFVSVKAMGGRLDVTGSCVTSWDVTQARVDTEHVDGRSFLLARDGAQLTIDRAELRYLGYGEVESYGLSWRTAGTTGGISGSLVSHLYYGLYSYEVGGLVVVDNEFHDNVLYGIDPHTGSRELRIERNVVHDNGKHGIILAEDCTDSVLRDNVVYRNDHHGIVLYLGSDRNLVEGNESFANTVQGININESAGNTLRGNRIYDNGEAGIGVTQTSRGTLVTDNQVRGNQQDGVRVVSDATDTTLRSNVIGENARYGVYVDSAGAVDLTGNTVVGNRAGIVLNGAVGTPAEDANTVRDNREADLVAQ